MIVIHPAKIPVLNSFGLDNWLVYRKCKTWKSKPFCLLLYWFSQSSSESPNKSTFLLCLGCSSFSLSRFPFSIFGRSSSESPNTSAICVFCSGVPSLFLFNLPFELGGFGVDPFAFPGDISWSSSLDSKPERKYFIEPIWENHVRKVLHQKKYFGELSSLDVPIGASKRWRKTQMGVPQSSPDAMLTWTGFPQKYVIQLLLLTSCISAVLPFGKH